MTQRKNKTKKIKLTKGYYATIDSEDFDRVSIRKWIARTFVSRDRVCAVASIGNKGVYLHRFIMNVTDPKILVYHIDRDGLNNAKSNLRLATPTQNMCNQKTQTRPNKSSRFKGVCWDKQNKKFISTIQFKYKQYFLGYYKTEEEAAEAYNKAAIKLHGEFARLNKV